MADGLGCKTGGKNDKNKVFLLVDDGWFMDVHGRSCLALSETLTISHGQFNLGCIATGPAFQHYNTAACDSFAVHHHPRGIYKTTLVYP